MRCAPLAVLFSTGLLTAQVQYHAGHYYEFVPASGTTWAAAQSGAALRTHLGISGHLATVESAGENSFLLSLAPAQAGFAGAWLSGTVDLAGNGIWQSGSSLGVVFWAAGAPVPGIYENWGGVEPNDAPSFAYMNVGPLTSGIATGEWADDDDGQPGPSDPVVGYFVEYEPTNTRTVALVTAPGLGITSQYAATYPSAAAGRFGFFLLTLPEPAAQPLTLPGFTSNGLLRVDLNNQLLTSFWLLDGTGSRGFSVPIPVDSVFQGFSFDVQTVDVDFTTNDLAWAVNDLELRIGQGVIGDGLNLARVEAGSFSMGSNVLIPVPLPPYFVSPNEFPVHGVTISQPFWIGRYEVTQAQFQSVMGWNPSAFVSPSRPVESVSWFDAMAYCSALNLRESAAGRVPFGYQYRLPTEAEWEYCCRAGSTGAYWFGSVITCGDANFSRNDHDGSTCTSGYTIDGGAFAANAFGLYDVAGNVFEWCLDSWDRATGYAPGNAVDPLSTVGAYRVARGGGWSFNSNKCRCAAREGLAPGGASNALGFRIVLGPARNP